VGVSFKSCIDEIENGLFREAKSGCFIERLAHNTAENALRPFVVGRKNWLFAGHPRGAEASAIFFSLIESAKANGLETYARLKTVFRQLLLTNEKDYGRLLPGNDSHVRKKLFFKHFLDFATPFL